LAQASLTVIDAAISDVSAARSRAGAISSRLTATVDNLGVEIENTSAANSRIRDVDVAHETAELTRQQILVRAATSVLAQANAAPQMALQLLG